MRTLEVAEAQARFAELIRDVERGESVAIACDGKTVARLAPAPQERDAASCGEALTQFLREKAAWKPVNVTREEILAWRHEGHKW